MTDFKITPEDVGRVAQQLAGNDWRILDYDTDQGDFPITARCGLSNYVDCFATDGHSYRGHGKHDLTHWKPRTLEAPKRWWNLFRDRHGEIDAYENETFSESVRAAEDPIARIYAEHWHGCEEGRFDTPESIGAPS